MHIYKYVVNFRHWLTQTYIYMVFHLVTTTAFFDKLAASAFFIYFTFTVHSVVFNNVGN